MNNYKIAIWNKSTRDKGELMALMEMQRPRFTKSEYDMAIREMFSWAAESYIYDYLTADVYCNNQKVLTIDCKTRQNGSEINSYISTGGKVIRRMCIAA